MLYLVSVIDTEGSTHKMEDIINACDFLAFLCSKCSSHSVGRVLDLDLLVKLEKAAKKWPEPCLLPSCIAIEGVVQLFPPDKSMLPSFSRADKSVFESLTQLRVRFYEQDHHVFVKETLSIPVVYTNSTLLQLTYTTFHKLLKHCTQEALTKMCNWDFIEFFVISFIRDVITFPHEANQIAFTAHYFIFQMKTKEPIEFLRELDFHTAVVELVKNTDSYDVTTTGIGLLACLTGKYYDHLKDIKPLLKTQLPAVLIAKAKRYGRIQRSHFGEDFGRILLNLTADKDLSLELYNKGYMEELVEFVDDEYTPVIKRCVIHAVGNIALGGQHIKQVLLDRRMYETLLQMLSRETDKGDAYLLSACCRVLHILASGDWAKRKYVECGCIEVLLRVMKTRKDNAEVSWRPLGLLSSLGFMAVMNRRYILTREIVEAVANILKKSTHGKVVSYTILVFLASGELDEGSTLLRELDIEDTLSRAIKNPDFLKQGPDLDR